jgi:uncharacterized protein YceK
MKWAILGLLVVLLSGCGSMENYRCVEGERVYFMPSENVSYKYRGGCND